MYGGGTFVHLAKIRDDMALTRCQSSVPKSDPTK
jgi:hypothetical protein